MNSTYVSLIDLRSSVVLVCFAYVSKGSRIACAPNAESHSVRLGDYPPPIGAKTMTSESGQ